MSDKESPPPKKLSPLELAQFIQRIKAQAPTRVPKTSDRRALEGDDYLSGVGETYLRQQIEHGTQLHRARLWMLGFLIFLVILWLASIPLLLLIAGTHWKDFEISDTVLIVYIGATTINVLGLLKIATKWLFTDKSAEAETSLVDAIKDLLNK
jgi:hypothetical protein